MSHSVYSTFSRVLQGPMSQLFNRETFYGSDRRDQVSQVGTRPSCTHRTHPGFPSGQFSFVTEGGQYPFFYSIAHIKKSLHLK